MNRSLSMSLAFASVCGALFVAGCSSSSSGTAAPADTGTPTTDTGGGDPCKVVTKEDPPIACPPDPTLPKCKSTAEVASCPSDTACMAVAKQTGDILNMRMGRIRLWAPDALLSLAPLAVDPNVSPKCANNGAETFNWLVQIDKKANTIKTGGAEKSADAKTWAFSTKKVNGADLSGICPGFVGPADPIDLSPITLPVVFTGNTFSSSKIDKINIPIFDASAPTPIVLPIQQGIVKNVTISADGNCIGSWNKDYWCDGDSLGWTTGGAIVGKITVEDADHIPVKSAGCQSLCAILANDASKVSGKTCKRGADGKIPNIGDATVTTTNDAFLLSATFSAYGANIAAP